MTYIVIELQTTATGEVAHILNVFTDRNNAEMKYHQILAAAAVSAIPTHAAVMLTSDGREVKHEAYTHVQPEPEPDEGNEE